MDSVEVVAEAIHPCVKCGACCGTYRVLFDPAEIKDEAYKVPKELTEKVDEKNLAMMGTNQHKPRCIALGGHIGKSVGCTIYLNRPSCCREFRASFEDGQRNPRCDEARRGKGLKPLSPRDYEAMLSK
jgi:uncharacterized protein